MVRTVRVELPIDQPKETLELCKATSEKHTALGLSSPLNGFLDMAQFEIKRASADQKQTLGNLRAAESQSFHARAMKQCGIAKGQNKQTEGTIYWYVLQIRDVLAIKNRTEEENLELWGFNVVVTQTGARRNVRIDIPDDNPTDLTELADAIKSKHIALGVGSPLTDSGIDMTDYGTKTATAVGLVASAKAADAEAQAQHGQALHILGYTEGQTSETAGTLYYDIIIVRDRLLQVNFDEEENLTLWGFEVIIDGHATGPKKDDGTEVPDPVTIQGELNILVATNINTANLSPLFTNVLLVAANSTMRYYLSTAPAALWTPGDAFIDVLPGTPVFKTIAELMILLGASDSKKYLNVQNVGATSGHYSVTVS